MEYPFGPMVLDCEMGVPYPRFIDDFTHWEILGIPLTMHLELHSAFIKDYGTRLEL